MKEPKTLDLNGQSVGDYDVGELLRNDINIEVLNISETGVPSLNFLYEFELDHLKEIDISTTSIKDLSPLIELKNLKVLHANYLQLENTEALSKLTNLEKLSLEYSNIENLSFLANLKKLKSLYLFGNKKIKDISSLHSLDNLEELSLQGTSVNDKSQLLPIRHKKFKKILVNESLESQVPFLIENASYKLSSKEGFFSEKTAIAKEEKNSKVIQTFSKFLEALKNVQDYATQQEIVEKLKDIGHLKGFEINITAAKKEIYTSSDKK